MRFSNNLLILNNYNKIESTLFIYNNFCKFYINEDSLETVMYRFTNLNNFFLFIFKKEKIYTKLKYSRVPQVDIASGSAASLFAGLVGFLVTEKFGFELLDSGDFYVLIVYLLFILSFIRIIFKLYIVDLGINNRLLFSLYDFFYYLRCLKKLFF
jgi:hypothetical protein